MNSRKTISSIIGAVASVVGGPSSSTVPRADRWNDEAFLNAVWDLLPDQVDWDSINFGALYSCSASATTFDGRQVVVVVLSKAGKTSEALADAELTIREESLPSETEIWLYVPRGFSVPADARIRRIDVG